MIGVKEKEQGRSKKGYDEKLYPLERRRSKEGYDEKLYPREKERSKKGYDEKLYPRKRRKGPRKVMTKIIPLELKKKLQRKTDQRKVKGRLRRKLCLRIKEVLKEVTTKSYTLRLKEIILRELITFKNLEISKVQKFENAKIQKFKNSKMQKFKSSKI